MPSSLSLPTYQIARLFDYVCEVPGNHGQRVNGIQAWGGGHDGDSWCAWFATMMLDIRYKGNAPIPRMGNVHEILQLADKNGWLLPVGSASRPDDLYVFVNVIGHGHHIGIVTPVGWISGNTSGDGTSSDGGRVAEKIGVLQTSYDSDTVRFIRLPLPKN